MNNIWCNVIDVLNAVLSECYMEYKREIEKKNAVLNIGFFKTRSV